MYSSFPLSANGMLRIDPDPVLRMKAKKFEHFDESAFELELTLLEQVEQLSGAGLAAPQIGISVQAAAFRNERFGAPEVVFNPQIVWSSSDTVAIQESCLSIPNRSILIYRPELVEIEYQDATGKFRTRRLNEFASRVVQHEIDHLRGVLITDYQHPAV